MSKRRINAGSDNQRLSQSQLNADSETTTLSSNHNINHTKNPLTDGLTGYYTVHNNSQNSNIIIHSEGPGLKLNNNGNTRYGRSINRPAVLDIPRENYKSYDNNKNPVAMNNSNSNNNTTNRALQGLDQNDSRTSKSMHKDPLRSISFESSTSGSEIESDESDYENSRKIKEQEFQYLIAVNTYAQQFFNSETLTKSSVNKAEYPYVKFKMILGEITDAIKEELFQLRHGCSYKEYIRQDKIEGEGEAKMMKEAIIDDIRNAFFKLHLSMLTRLNILDADYTESLKIAQESQRALVKSQKTLLHEAVNKSENSDEVKILVHSVNKLVEKICERADYDKSKQESMEKQFSEMIAHNAKQFNVAFGHLSSNTSTSSGVHLFDASTNISYVQPRSTYPGPVTIPSSPSLSTISISSDESSSTNSNNVEGRARNNEPDMSNFYPRIFNPLTSLDTKKNSHDLAKAARTKRKRKILAQANEDVNSDKFWWPALKGRTQRIIILDDDFIANRSIIPNHNDLHKAGRIYVIDPLDNKFFNKNWNAQEIFSKIKSVFQRFIEANDAIEFYSGVVNKTCHADLCRFNNNSIAPDGYELYNKFCSLANMYIKRIKSVEVRLESSMAASESHAVNNSNSSAMMNGLNLPPLSMTSNHHYAPMNLLSDVLTLEEANSLLLTQTNLISEHHNYAL